MYVNDILRVIESINDNTHPNSHYVRTYKILEIKDGKFLIENILPSFYQLNNDDDILDKFIREEKIISKVDSAWFDVRNFKIIYRSEVGQESIGNIMDINFYINQIRMDYSSGKKENTNARV